MKEPFVKIGTSGWVYSHWQNSFYPKGVKTPKYLFFYIQKFDTVEINSSFYHLPLESTFLKWYKETPKNFLFSVKALRFISHVKKLKDCQEPLEIFLKRAFLLKEKLGPILFQMPPSFKARPEILENFLKLFEKFKRKAPNPPLRVVFEFRNKDCFKKEIFEILKKYKAALCFADSPCYPYLEKETADFVYLRLHGHQKLYASCYSKKEIKEWAKKIKNWSKKKPVYVYFDNDAQGFAAKNALELKEELKMKI